MGICQSQRNIAERPFEEDDEVYLEHPARLDLPHEIEPLIPEDHQVQDFMEGFRIIKTLGEGSTCAVYQMEDATSGHQVAVKRMLRSAKSTHRGFKREAEILLKINHNHIVCLYGLYADREYFWIAQELCTGGMVLEHVRKRKQFTEEDAIEIVNQIIRGVGFLHAHNVVHRDIKPDNIVYQSNRRNRVVLIDFGQAREVNPEQEFSDWVGTPAYMAPEVTIQRTGAHLKKVDMWAVGVTAFVLLTGFLPFFGHNVKELMREICQKKLTFPKSVPLSTPARKFVAALLRRNIGKRFSADEALQDHWLVSPAQTARANLKEWTDNVASYAGSSGMKRMVVDIVKMNMSEEERRTVQEAFNLIDVDHDGSIQEEELVEFLKGRNYTAERADLRSKIVADAIRADTEQKIDIDTFTESALTARLGTDEDLIAAMFRRLDQNGDGMITANEIQMAKGELFGEDVSLEECEQMIAEIDKNSNGYVTMHGFSRAMVHLTQRGKRPPYMMDVLQEDEEM